MVEFGTRVPGNRKFAIVCNTIPCSTSSASADASSSMPGSARKGKGAKPTRLMEGPEHISKVFKNVNKLVLPQEEQTMSARAMYDVRVKLTRFEDSIHRELRSLRISVGRLSKGPSVEQLEEVFGDIDNRLKRLEASEEPTYAGGRRKHASSFSTPVELQNRRTARRAEALETASHVYRPISHQGHSHVRNNPAPVLSRRGS